MKSTFLRWNTGRRTARAASIGSGHRTALASFALSLAPLLASACASNESYLRREVAPLAQKRLACPEEQIATRCLDAKCYEAEAAGCGQVAEYHYGQNGWTATSTPPMSAVAEDPASAASVPVTVWSTPAAAPPPSAPAAREPERAEAAANVAQPTTTTGGAAGNPGHTPAATPSPRAKERPHPTPPAATGNRTKETKSRPTGPVDCVSCTGTFFECTRICRTSCESPAPGSPPCDPNCLSGCNARSAACKANCK